MNADLTGCIPCSTLGSNTVSPAGVRCEACTPGKEPLPDRSACVDCLPGTYSPSGNCANCSSLGSTFYSGSGASRCDSCPAGTEPNAARSLCSECRDGYVSPFGICEQCQPGRQSDEAKVTCVSCEQLGPAQFSSDGAACQPCPLGTQPDGSRSACDDCPHGTLPIGGTCVEACAALGCQNYTVSSSTGSFEVNSVGELCPGAFA